MTPTYEVEYQIHESQVPKDDWVTLQLSEPEAHEWFDRYVTQQDILAVRVVRIDRTVIRESRKP